MANKNTNKNKNKNGSAGSKKAGSAGSSVNKSGKADYAASKNRQSAEETLVPVTEEEADSIRVTVDLDDGSTEECSILTILTVGGQDYIALLPMDDKDQPNEDGMVYLYRYYEDENGIPSMDNIDDDDEYEAVFDAFDEWQDDLLFDSME